MSRANNDIEFNNAAASDSTTPIPALDPNDINIVLLGETGVGKSTFINAFVNYLKFSTLEEATLSPEIHCLIASRFTVTDENFEERLIRFGEDENECAVAGASATQSARSYRFTLNDRTVRLIDTPGIGDTRGVKKDEENFDRLLEFLAELKYVHAFCFLLKPNNAKLTVLFQYCIKQLLSRLDKTASRNILFVFTNSRSTFYKPGDSLVPVKEILRSINESTGVTIKFDKDNVFCMDNEAFRFLLASREGIDFTDAEKRDFAASWDKSAGVAVAMLETVKSLAPHKMQDTMNINEARRLILNLSAPLAVVAKNIDDNLRIIERKKAELTDKNMTIEQLNNALHFEMVRLKNVDIDHPRTVCTHSDCTDVHIIEGSKHIDYKQVCHRRCYLKGIPKQVIGSPELRKCEAMDWSPFNPSCRHCRHSYSMHMHIYFITETYVSKEIDKKVDADIKKEEDIRRQIKNMIDNLENRRTGLENEKDIVQKSMAKFAHFLSNNAITPYNDAYQEYITYLIHNENAHGPAKDDKLIQSYEALINVHQVHTHILAEQLEKAKESNVDAKVITAEDVVELVNRLYKLEFCGPVIRDFYDKQQQMRQRETFLHTEKNVDARRWYDPIKKKYNQIVPKAMRIE